MNEEKLKRIWQAMDTRVTTINNRTKAQTIKIEELRRDINKIMCHILKMDTDHIKLMDRMDKLK